jgi:hypothetical protein
LGKDWKGESEESGNTRSESDIEGAAGSLDDNRPTPQPKRKAVDALEDIHGSENVAGNTGSTTVAGPPIPMMTIPCRMERGSSKQVTSSSGVDNDKEPEGPVSYCPTFIATQLI